MPIICYIKDAELNQVGQCATISSMIPRKIFFLMFLEFWHRIHIAEKLFKKKFWSHFN